MLDINLIRENPDLVRKALRDRQLGSDLVEEILAKDKERREKLTQCETLKAERNKVSKEISVIKDAAAKQKKIEAMRKVGDEISLLDAEVTSIEGNLHNLIASVPNIPEEGVPIGKDDNENVILEPYDQPKLLPFQPVPHWDLGPRLGILNFEQGVKLSGSRFYILQAEGARLERALIAWMLDLHIRQGYTEIYPPYMVRGDVLFAAGQLPKFAGNLYHDVEEDFWMVPTAEVPLTGMHMNDTLDEARLPLRYTAYTACFRREKMSAGRDVRGIKRGHQFDKVEMYIYCSPEESGKELEKMLSDAIQTCQELGLTHRVKKQCTGDLGFNAKFTYDVEVWAAGCAEWLEVSSVSNVGDFQARRANIKYRLAEGGKTRLLHTLNGSGLGLPRTLIAILENYQQANGRIAIPEVLKPWMGGITEIG
jgi:seryl-tRNA synthetase